jgi:hypothetical protein
LLIFLVDIASGFAAKVLMATEYALFGHVNYPVQKDL